MPRTLLQQNPLVERTGLDVKRAFRISQVRRNVGACSHFASVGVRPLDHASYNAARSDNAATCQPIKIKLQSGFEGGALAWSRHGFRY